MAVRVAPGMGWARNPSPSITRITPAISGSVAPAFMTINMTKEPLLTGTNGLWSTSTHSTSPHKSTHGHRLRLQLFSTQETDALKLCTQGAFLLAQSAEYCIV